MASITPQRRVRTAGCWLPIAALVLLSLPASAVTAASTGTVTGGDATITRPTGGNAAPKASRSPAAKPTVSEARLRQLKSQRSGAKPDGDLRSPFAPPTAAILSLPGADQTQTLRPPDTHGAVGRTQFAEIVNSKLSIRSKDTGALACAETSLNSFFNYTAQTIFDPRVVYDKLYDRFVIFAEAFPETSTAAVQRTFLAASTSDNACGTYHKYSLDLPDAAGDFFDYPQLGMDQDALIITANIFASSGPYKLTRMFAPPKASIYNGRGFSVPYFNLGAIGTTAPPIVEDNNAFAYLLTAPPSGSTVRVTRAANLGRSNASVTFQANVPVAAYTAPPDAGQPGTTNLLDTLDARFVNASTQIGDEVVNVHTVGSGSFPIPRYYVIDTGGTSANTVKQTGSFFESGPSHDWNASIVGSSVGGTAAAPIGRMFFTWSATQPSGTGAHQASVKGSGRLRSDPTSVVGGQTFFASTTFYNPSTATVERWGDYSATTLDPTASIGCGLGQRAYIVNQKINSQTLWGSRIGRMGFC